MFETILALEPVSTTLLLKLLVTYLATKEGVGIFKTIREQNRTKDLGQQNIDFLNKQLLAKSEGEKRAFESSEASLERFLQLTQEDKAKDRSERRTARSDSLRLAGNQQQLAILATIMQSLGQQTQQRNLDDRALREPAPISVVNSLRGLL